MNIELYRVQITSKTKSKFQAISAKSGFSLKLKPLAIFFYGELQLANLFWRIKFV
jgi:hypothetical protein